MSIKLRLLTLVLLLAAFSCKKENSKPEKEKVPGNTKVTISGKEYTAVKIGDQYWTNINYAGEGGIWSSSVNPKPEYGKYYSFSETQQISLPEGWRIPTEADYRELLDSAGIKLQNSAVSNPEQIKTLTSEANWKHVAGTNTSGFNAYPGGYSINNSDPLDGDLSEFWMADSKTFCIMESGNLTSYRIIFYANSNQPLDRFNLRFVKDIK